MPSAGLTTAPTRVNRAPDGGVACESATTPPPPPPPARAASARRRRPRRVPARAPSPDSDRARRSSGTTSTSADTRWMSVDERVAVPRRHAAIAVEELARRGARRRISARVDVRSPAGGDSATSRSSSTSDAAEPADEQRAEGRVGRDADQRLDAARRPRAGGARARGAKPCAAMRAASVLRPRARRRRPSRGRGSRRRRRSCGGAPARPPSRPAGSRGAPPPRRPRRARRVSDRGERDAGRAQDRRQVGGLEPDRLVALRERRARRRRGSPSRRTGRA